jgi:hypothetical protein
MSQNDIFFANTHFDYSSCKHNGTLWVDYYYSSSYCIYYSRYSLATSSYLYYKIVASELATRSSHSS